MSELGVRRLGFLGVHGIQKIWQRIYGAGQEVLDAMPERARRAAQFMHDGAWADALLALGAIRMGEATGRLRGLYEEATNTYGEQVRRWVGFVDEKSGEEWRAPRWVLRAAKKSSDDAVFTFVDRCTRGAVGAARGDPPDGGGGHLRATLKARLAAAGPVHIAL